ncbi:hypothetical protein M0802_010834 [Mischocyttarus mexicanus]|nr:hypothetical protein M0802_010834 [Mischocyttarus mexicanus]
MNTEKESLIIRSRRISFYYMIYLLSNYVLKIGQLNGTSYRFQTGSNYVGKQGKSFLPPRHRTTTTTTTTTTVLVPILQHYYYYYTTTIINAIPHHWTTVYRQHKDAPLPAVNWIRKEEEEEAKEEEEEEEEEKKDEKDPVGGGTEGREGGGGGRGGVSTVSAPRNATRRIGAYGSRATATAIAKAKATATETAKATATATTSSGNHSPSQGFSESLTRSANEP